MSLDAMKQALELLESAHVATDLVWKRHDCITALRAAIEQAQLELETYKRLYELRGKALERPCISCGYQPKKIKTMAQPEPAPGYCKHCKQYSIEEPLPSQTEQKPVAWMHPSWIDPDTRGWSNDSFSAIPIEGWVPVYTTPRQWQAQEPVSGAGFESLPASPTTEQGPVSFNHDIGSDRFKVVRGAFWWHVLVGDSPTEHGKFRSRASAEKMAADLLREFRNGAFVQHTAPRQWQGLTEEEVRHCYFGSRADFMDYARAIEAKLKERNT